jgi:hypothetical protein
VQVFLGEGFQADVVKMDSLFSEGMSMQLWPSKSIVMAREMRRLGGIAAILIFILMSLMIRK